MAKKKTHAASSGKADNQTQLPKKKADKSSVMEISTIPDPHTSLKREVTKSYGANYVSKLLDNALYQTGSSLDQIPPREYTIQAHQCYPTDDPNRFAYNDLLTAADGMCPPLFRNQNLLGVSMSLIGMVDLSLYRRGSRPLRIMFTGSAECHCAMYPENRIEKPVD